MLRRKMAEGKNACPRECIKIRVFEYFSWNRTVMLSFLNKDLSKKSLRTQYLCEYLSFLSIFLSFVCLLNNIVLLCRMIVYYETPFSEILNSNIATFMNIWFYCTSVS